ncbi:MAG: RidA family protein [Rhizorhabdus sp.]|jgi:enamine deaminase RidA (YjgF/YER057c/UK114 family)|uniref:RidA family protein n=1 Tax=Rhizorhabdus sp. TaxID=1968843 RepID=UPI001B6FC83B|nr:RidA family protein [Rhizorhabdus sp.]MBP8233361.1 RidA family protein [Rhizorhabdus sp.]
MANNRINPDSMYNSLVYGFSHAAVQTSGKTIHLAGQVAWDKDCNIVGGDDLAAQTRQTLANIKTVVEAAGGTIADIVRLRIYVVNHSPDKLGVVLPEVGAFFGDVTPPPNTFLGVQALALPDFLIEIEATAAID